MKPKDITGQVFGSLTAVRITDRRSSSGSLFWEFVCKCGKPHFVTTASATRQARTAKNPGAPSCGCHKKAQHQIDATTHGMTRTNAALYAVYRSMLERCSNPNHAQFAIYGGKGVRVCDEWLADPAAFFSWALANGWEKGKHIDKDLKNKGALLYSPETCSILTAAENIRLGSARENWRNNARIKITPAQKDEIQQLYATGRFTTRDLAARYGVSQPAIQRLTCTLRNTAP